MDGVFRAFAGSDAETSAKVRDMLEEVLKFALRNHKPQEQPAKPVTAVCSAPQRKK